MIKRQLLILSLAALQLFCGVAAISACDSDSAEVVEKGVMGETFWMSPTDSTNNTHHTLKFSGRNSCRYRFYVTPYVDIDHHATYSVADDGTIVLTEKIDTLGILRQRNDSTLELQISGETIIFTKQNIH